MQSNARDAAIQNAEASNLSLHNLSKIASGGKRRSKRRSKKRGFCSCKVRGKCKCKKRCTCRRSCRCKCRTKRYSGGNSSSSSSSITVQPLPYQSLNPSLGLVEANRLTTQVGNQATAFAVLD
jgi:hypothetical protein